MVDRWVAVWWLCTPTPIVSSRCCEHGSTRFNVVCGRHLLCRIIRVLLVYLLELRVTLYSFEVAMMLNKRTVSRCMDCGAFLGWCCFMTRLDILLYLSFWYSSILLPVIKAHCNGVVLHEGIIAYCHALRMWRTTRRTRSAARARNLQARRIRR